MLDACSRRCIGWAFSQTNDTALTLKALNQAIENRQIQPGLIHHTDRGSNYTSGQYQVRLLEVGAKISHSRPGRPQKKALPKVLLNDEL